MHMFTFSSFFVIGASHTTAKTACSTTASDTTNPDIRSKQPQTVPFTHPSDASQTPKRQHPKCDELLDIVTVIEMFGAKYWAAVGCHLEQWTEHSARPHHKWGLFKSIDVNVVIMVNHNGSLNWPPDMRRTWNFAKSMIEKTRSIGGISMKMVLLVRATQNMYAYYLI